VASAFNKTGTTAIGGCRATIRAQEIGKIISFHLFDRNGPAALHALASGFTRGVFPGDRTDGVFEILSRVPGRARERIQSPLLSLAQRHSSERVS